MILTLFRALVAAVVLALVGWVVVVLGGGIHRGDRYYQPRGDMRATSRVAQRERMYPGNRGEPIMHDPTHGNVDRDIQWRVNDEFQPSTLGLRVALENRLQAQRARREGRLR